MSANQPPTGFVIEALTSSHNRTAFSCGIEELDKYFRNQIGQDMRRNVATPFLLIEEPTGAIAGFYTLAMKSVKLTEMSEATQKELPRYPNVPAVLIGRMGVDIAYKGQGLGKALLFDALKRAYQTSKNVAAFAVVVDAKHGAEGFYSKYGFMPYSDQENCLYLPMKTIEKLVG